MPATPVFTRKQVFHSDLRAKGALRVVLVTAPKASRFPDRLPWCRFAVDGSDQQFELQIENAAVFETLAKLEVGRTVMISAEGSREDARIQVLDEDATLAYPDTHPLAPAARAVPTRSSGPATEPSLARRYFGALEAAVTLLQAFESRYGRSPTENERALATTMFLSQRDGAHRPLKGTGGGK